MSLTAGGPISASWVVLNQVQWIVDQESQIANDLQRNPRFGGPYQAVRELRPSDLVAAAATYTNIISPTSPAAGNYSLSIAPATTASITFSLVNKALAIYGWYVNGDLGPAGYIQVLIDTVVRQEVPGEVALNAVGDRIYLLDQVVFVPQGSAVTFSIRNGSASTVTAVIWPLAFIAGTASALGVAPV